jgi:general secretion pathway protein B
MSYILDALKKSESERSRNVAMNPQALSLHPPIKENRRIPWPILMFVIVGLGVGGFYVWKYALLKQTRVIEHSETKIISPNKDTLVATLAKKDFDKPKQMMTEPKSDVRKIIKPKANQIRKTKQPSKQRTTIPKEIQQPKVVFSETYLDAPGLDNSMTNTKPGKSIISKISLDEIPNISYLPLDVRNQIPSINFDGHVYSGSQAQRSVMINGRKMREGEIVSSNLILEKITKRGAEFKFDGYRFKLGALQDWAH